MSEEAKCSPCGSKGYIPRTDGLLNYQPCPKCSVGSTNKERLQAAEAQHEAESGVVHYLHEECNLCWAFQRVRELEEALEKIANYKRRNPGGLVLARMAKAALQGEAVGKAGRE